MSPQLPGLLTRIIAAIVRPRNASKETSRCEALELIMFAFRSENTELSSTGLFDLANLLLHSGAKISTIDSF